ncbi:helix-turn-helix domain-containing protein [Streptomyces sp. HC44]|uniref:Helix-turn-helix domain-containing protein n=1 Tax=Streptomyces scabichelini TaxID=2711217 RepID=A0A6G4V4E4_9ACTN|nr:helix-turn-helix domain-containing protein [Streptomyces scabichelini]NGO08723.1 helix-turn-helix domain-containing protein [Streptomyces scabichelini]
MGRPEADLDPGLGPVQRFAFELRKLRQEAGGITYRQMARQVEVSVTTLSRAAAGEQLPSLPVALAYVRACGGEEKAWERRWREAVTEQARAADLVADETAPSPYRGLARFDVGDADLFFGRDEMADALVRAGTAHRVFAVFGPSGSGKSSLLRAGLIPRLRSLEGPHRPATVRILTPGEHPLRTHDTLCVPAPGEGDTWLVVDQFEEVFTLCRDPAERAGFLARLLAAAEPASRLRVVLGVRADFYGRCAEHRELADALAEANLPVGPMSPAELREAVVRPAQAAGLIVERELTARLVEETGGEPGGLPLLSHALRETWRRRRGRALTMAAYEAAGGVRGAIAQTAEDAYGTLSGEQAVLARQILLRLITPGEGSQDTRRPVDRAELDFAPSGEVALVLDRLARSRLLTLDDDTVDLAHEALITSWPRLSAWIEEARERLRTHRRLTEAARTWDELGRDPGALYRGTRLATADEHLADQPLTPLEEAFLTAARTSRSSELRRRRGLFTTLAALLVLALIAGITAWQQSRTSDRRHHEAEARRIAAVADSVRFADPVRAMQLSVAAWRLAETTETRSALLGATTQQQEDKFSFPDTASRPIKQRLAADGHTLLAVYPDSIRTWDLRTRRLTHTYRGLGKLLHEGEEVDEWTDTVELSPDGRTLALVQEKGVLLWDIRAERIAWRLDGESPSEVRFGPSGRTLVADDIDTSHLLRVWDVRNHRLRTTVSLGFDNAMSARETAVSPDDRLLYACSDDRPPEVWDIAERRKLDLPRLAALGRDACHAQDVAFSPDSRSLAMATDTGIRRWDLGSGRELSRLAAGSPYWLRFSPDGRFLAAVVDGHILVWRLSVPDTPVYRHVLVNELPEEFEFDLPTRTLRYRTEYSTTVRTVSLGPAVTTHWHDTDNDYPLSQLAPDGRTLALFQSPLGGTTRLRLQDTRSGRALATPPVDPCAADVHPEDIDCYDMVAWSANSRYVAVGRVGEDSSGVRAGRQRIIVWDVRTGRAHATVDIRPQEEGFSDIFGIALSPDGDTLLVARELPQAVTEVWDLREQGQVRKARSLTGTGVLGMVVRPDTGKVVDASGAVADPRSGRVVQRTLTEDQTETLAFSADGAYLAASDSGGRVTLWDGDVHTRLGVLAGTYTGAPFPEADSNVTALAFSPDGRTLAVAGLSGTLQLWDTASRSLLGSALPTPGDPILSVAFTEDGDTLYTTGKNVRLQRYEIAPERLVRQACTRAGSSLSPADWKTYLPDIPYRRTC